jgi:hypothetical protein
MEPRQTQKLVWITVQITLEKLLAHVGNQRHEAGAFDRFGHRMLADGGASAFAAAQDFSLAIGKLFQQFHVFVIDIHGMRALTFDEDRILFLRFDLGFRPAFADFVDLQFSRHSMFLCDNRRKYPKNMHSLHCMILRESISLQKIVQKTIWGSKKILPFVQSTY